MSGNKDEYICTYNSKVTELKFFNDQKFFETNCGRYFPKILFDQIKGIHYCPFCGNEIKISEVKQ